MKADEYQRHLFTGRYRKVRGSILPSESQIQIALIQRLKIMGRPDVTYFHCPNGGERSKRAAALFKAMGVSPGVSDLLFFWPYRKALFLELKADKGDLTAEQEFFLERMRKCGFDAECAHGLDEAVSILESYGLLSKSLTKPVYGDGPRRIG